MPLAVTAAVEEVGEATRGRPLIWSKRRNEGQRQEECSRWINGSSKLGWGLQVAINGSGQRGGWVQSSEALRHRARLRSQKTGRMC